MVNKAAQKQNEVGTKMKVELLHSQAKQSMILWSNLVKSQDLKPN